MICNKVVLVIKGAERYIFMYHDGTRADLIRLVNRYATDPELSFNGEDAEKVCAELLKSKSSRFQLPE